jgi:hypothetical protein
MCNAVDNELTGMAWVAGLMGYGGAGLERGGQDLLRGTAPVGRGRTV